MVSRLVSFLSLLLLFSPVAAAQSGHLTDAQVERYNNLANEATAIADRYIIIEGRTRAPPDVAELARALRLYDEALQINDGRYGVWWMRGKIYQVLQQPHEALASFRRAYELEPSNQPIINEMTIQAVELGEFAFALEATERGLLVFPNDLALRARLALVQLLSGNLDEAIIAADRALQLAPDDRISREIRRIAVEVREGRRTQPHSMRDLMR